MGCGTKSYPEGDCAFICLSKPCYFLLDFGSDTLTQLRTVISPFTAQDHCVIEYQRSTLIHVCMYPIWGIFRSNRGHTLFGFFSFLKTITSCSYPVNPVKIAFDEIQVICFLLDCDVGGSIDCFWIACTGGRSQC